MIDALRHWFLERTTRDPRWPHDFRHRRTMAMLRPREVLELRRSFPPPHERGAAADIPVAAGRTPVARAGEISVTWLGHASALLGVDGVSVLVDPVLAGGIPGARARLTPPGLTVAQLPPIDALLISHDHYDHLDEPTVRLLPRDTRVLVGAGGGPWFRARGFTDVTELDWWCSASLDEAGDAERSGEHADGGAGPSVTVEFVPVHHWSRRGPVDACRRLWGGWVVTGRDGRAVLHAGDTGYGPYLAAVGRRHPGIAVALLPVGAYAPRRLLRGVHMDPAEAVRAAGDVGAGAMVPIHWGTFVLSGEPVTEPIERTRAEWAAAGRDRDALWDLAIGETRTL